MVGSAGNELRVGVDIGGTFTDLMMIGHSGQVEIGKVLTTPDPSRGVEEVLAQTLDRSGHAGASVRHLVHGTTLVTNAIIERKGARTALLTTSGFRDSIEIGREHRYELYDLNLEHPRPLVPRHLRFDVPERTLTDGTQTIELGEDYVVRLVRELSGAGVEAVAICFLHSFTNPESEERARDVVKGEVPEMRVSLSSEIVPEIGEFERASTTIANVYVQPLVEDYLHGLRRRMERIGFEGQLFVMLSSGGVATLDTCVRFPIRLLESGPAAGALAAASVGTAMGRDSLAVLRHGRHHRQAERGGRGRAAGHPRLRGGPPLPLQEGLRASRQGAGDRDDRDRRGRGIHRPGRLPRTAQGGSRLGRRRSRTGLLRPRR